MLGKEFAEDLIQGAEEQKANALRICTVSPQSPDLSGGRV